MGSGAVVRMQVAEWAGQLEGDRHVVQPVQVLLVRAEHQGPHGGAQPVRADHQIEPLGDRGVVGGVGQGDVHAVGILLDVGRHSRVADFDVLRQRGEGGRLDVTAHHHPGAARQVLVGEAAGPPVSRTVDVVVGAGRDAVVQVVEDAQPVGGRPAPAEQRDEVSTGPSRRGPLDHDRGPSDLPEPQGGRDPTDAESDHQGPAVLVLAVADLHASTID